MSSQSLVIAKLAIQFVLPYGCGRWGYTLRIYALYIMYISPFGERLLYMADHPYWKYSDEEREHKIGVIQNQKKTDNGVYYRLLENLYNYYVSKANSDGTGDKCYSDIKEMMATTFAGTDAYRSVPVLLGYQRDLIKFDYIALKKDDNDKWYVEILRPLDF